MKDSTKKRLIIAGLVAVSVSGDLWDDWHIAPQRAR